MRQPSLKSKRMPAGPCWVGIAGGGCRLWPLLDEAPGEALEAAAGAIDGLSGSAATAETTAVLRASAVFVALAASLVSAVWVASAASLMSAPCVAGLPADPTA